jgi:hypothetical protein
MITVVFPDYNIFPDYNMFHDYNNFQCIFIDLQKMFPGNNYFFRVFICLNKKMLSDFNNV